MEAIKLFKIDTTEDEVERFHTQLCLARGNAVASFVRGKDGVMRVWKYKRGCPGWHQPDKPYIIVEDIIKMDIQQL